MLSNILSDGELIYYIRQNNKEAFGLLFLRYKTKMKHFLNLYNLGHLLIKDEDAINGIYDASFLSALNAYEMSKGKFYSLVYVIFRNQICIFMNKNYLHIKNEQIEAKEYLFSSKSEYHIDLHSALEKLVDFDDLSYRVICLWMKGYRYEDISAFLSIPTKKVYYQMKKGIDYLKLLMKDVDSF
jgi:DNA-directed RNA polymerase specialized sigma24 family protein